MATFSQTINWTGFFGSKTSVTVENCRSFDEASSKALEIAKKMGWTPPRKWQFWRRRDTRLNM